MASKEDSKTPGIVQRENQRIARGKGAWPAGREGHQREGQDSRALNQLTVANFVDSGARFTDPLCRYIPIACLRHPSNFDTCCCSSAVPRPTLTCRVSLCRARRYHGACARSRLQPDRLRSFGHDLGGGRRQATGSCDHRPRRRLFLASVHGGSFRALDHRSRCAGRLVAVHDHGRRPARLRAPCARQGLRKDRSGDQRSRCARRPYFKCSRKQRPVRRRSGGRGQRRGWRRSRGKEDGRRAWPAGRIFWLAQAERGVFLHSRWRGVGIDSRCDHGRHGVVEAHGTRGSVLAILSPRAVGNRFCFERAGVCGSRPAPHGGCFCRGTVRKCGAHELLLWASFRCGPHDGVQSHRRWVHGFSALVVRGGRAGGHRSHKIPSAQISDDTAETMTLDSRSHGRTRARGLQEQAYAAVYTVTCWQQRVFEYQGCDV